ncbi:4'-phosphopantetheinyl transferase family protein [Pseudarthrobacter albicanus]|uniref:4'-phosphopantetheinyl transferase family protein n=1 Tax=Pseudarthrobacter albicanus TaxID=2823873 RepID=UPI0027DD0048|nr:4'-phosphopantetheinyl transferase superfamily protein [Pseudarthrobacter albicanus]
MQPLPVVRSFPPIRLSGCPEGHPEGRPEGRPGGLERDALALLDAVELQRAAAMMPGPRAAFLSGRLAQRRFAAELLGVPASRLTVDYRCPRCGTGAGISHGRPGYAVSGSSLAGSAAPLLLSLSRSSGWTVLAAVPDPEPGLRLGIDVEDPARMDFDGFDDVALAPAEKQELLGLAGTALLRARARLWTRKEAWLKMGGEGLRTAPETLDVLHRTGLRDLPAAETGLPADLVAAVGLSA